MARVSSFSDGNPSWLNRELAALPRILIIDDLAGRLLAEGRNEERANLCGQFLLEDVTMYMVEHERAFDLISYSCAFAMIYVPGVHDMTTLRALP